MMRSVVAVLAGLGSVSILVELLEVALVSAVAGSAVTDMTSYFAVKNRPMMLGAQLGYNSIAAVLGGYLTAKLAGTREMLHGAAAALLKMAALAWGFTLGDYAEFTPAWMRIMLVLLTGPAMLAGASIRARAVRSGS